MAYGWPFPKPPAHMGDNKISVKFLRETVSAGGLVWAGQTPLWRAGGAHAWVGGGGARPTLLAMESAAEFLWGKSRSLKPGSEVAEQKC